MPDITPDWSAPFLSALGQLANWALAICLVLSAIALIFSGLTLAGKGFQSQRAQEFAGKYIGYAIGAVLFFGSVNTFWHLAYTFKVL